MMLVGRAAAFLLVGRPLPTQVLGTKSLRLAGGISSSCIRRSTPASIASSKDFLSVFATDEESSKSWIPSVQRAELETKTTSNPNHSKKENRRRKSLLTWEDKFALLRQYKKEHGNCDPPANYVVHGVKLGGWAATQRKEYRKYQAGLFSSIINAKRIFRLERHGFRWEGQQVAVGGAAMIGNFCKSLVAKSPVAGPDLELSPWPAVPIENAHHALCLGFA